MLNRVIEWSLRNQLLVMVGLVLAILGGIWSVRESRIDAIPDLSDVQVILFTEYQGQAPQVVEDQVTYPITSVMLAVPFAKVVRGYSFFGFSFVYVIFEDGTDLYWARSRVLEYVSGLSGDLPPGVTPQLGPDATGVGWAFMYVLNSQQRSLAELRSLQDWYLKYGLSSVEGVAEVASIGGFVRQYQVEVDPVRLRAYSLPLEKVRHAIQRSNAEVGGRLVEMSEREYMVRGRGYVREIRDLETVVLGSGPGGVPILLRDVANVTIGPEIRRGLAEWNGEGETVGGVVVVRWGADTRSTIARVKDRLAELEAGLPDDVQIEVAYDRTGLIDRSIETLAHTLLEELIVVSLVCMLFLFHLRSALVAIVSIPASILIAFIIMRAQGLGANIMSLGGIAISIGVLVDASVIMVENAHKHYEEWKGERSHFEIILRSAQEVGPTLFFTLLIITVSFLPIFTLQAQEGRLFRPLAFTKTYAIGVSSLLAVTVIPVLMFWFVRGRMTPESRHPISRFLQFLYRPFLRAALRWRWAIVLGAVVLLVVTLAPMQRIGSEFMPPLWEGDLLYMPTTFPGVSISKAKEIAQQTDKIIRSFPEVESVFGKVGRAQTATDPAPLSMLETTIVLKDPAEWRPGLTKDDLIAELDAAIQFPGVTNAWTMPIKTRIDMLSTGIKTPVGIKVGGPDLVELERIAEEIEAVVKPLPGTLSAYAERVMGGSYLDFDIDREAAARFGLNVGDIQDVVQSAIGGMNVSWTVEGLERYPINLRYPRELRDSPAALREILVATPSGAQVPLGQLAALELRQGPPGIKSENARPNAWVYVDLRGIDVGSWVERAKNEVAERVELPLGYTIVWSGQYEYMQRAKARLLIIVPLTLLAIFLILYFHTSSIVKTLLVLAAVPLSLVGSIWILDWLGYNWSVAVWVGVIALAGLATEFGVVMLLFLDLAYDRQTKDGKLTTLSDLARAVDGGAVQRIRPMTMTTATTLFALVPILWAGGTGADVMRRIAAPMVGGIVTSFVGVLFVLPALYFLWRSIGLERGPLFPKPASAGEGPRTEQGNKQIEVARSRKESESPRSESHRSESHIWEGHRSAVKRLRLTCPRFLAASLTCLLLVLAGSVEGQSSEPGGGSRVGEGRASVAASLSEGLPAPLHDLIEEVLDRNPRIALMKRRAAALSTHPSQVGFPDPTASLSLFVQSPETRVGPQRLLVSFAQKFPWFGKLGLKRQAAALVAEAADADIESARLELVTETRSLFWELVFQQELDRIVTEERQVLSRYEEASRARYSAGLGLQQESVRIQAQLTRLATRLLAIAERRATLLASVNALRDRPSNTPIEGLGGLSLAETSASELTVAESRLVLDHLRQSALLRRPALFAADAIIAAQDALVELAKKQFRPDLSFGLGYTVVDRRSDPAGRAAPPPDNGDDVLALTGSLNLPIHRRRLDSSLEEALALRSVAEEQKRQLEAEIERSIGDLASRIPLLYEQRTLFEQVLLVQAEEALVSAETAYATGRLNAVDLLDSEVVLFEVQRSIARTRTDLAVAIAKLEGEVASKLPTTGR